MVLRSPRRQADFPDIRCDETPFISAKGVGCCHFNDRRHTGVRDAQQPSAAIVTHADARKVLEIIKGDSAKTEAYCDMVHLGHEMAAADEKKADELNQEIGQLQRKLGPEYTALMEGFQDLDLGSEVGQEISSMFAALDGLCGG